MSVALIVALVLAVVALCAATVMITRSCTMKSVRQKQQSKTQVYLLPPPVQSRSARLSSSDDLARAQSSFLSPIQGSQRSSSTHLALICPATEPEIEFESRPEPFPDFQPSADLQPKPLNLPTIGTSRPRNETTNTTATFLSDITDTSVEPKAVSFAQVSTNTVAPVRSQTFMSMAAEPIESYSPSVYSPLGSPSLPPMVQRPRSLSSTWMEETIEASEPPKPLAPPEPEVPEDTPYQLPDTPKPPTRSRTFASLNTSIRSSTGSAHSWLETPVVRTAVAYNLAYSSELPRSSMVRLHDEFTSPTHVPTAYVPYRPAPPSG